ncbi:MAG: DUF2927 domain-containing protein [Alphaproteobacteria bacterium]|nr:DUF2927 domain-containing protein [Alphaproteobacteria bacterium]
MKINKLSLTLFLFVGITLFYSFGFAENNETSVEEKTNQSKIPDEIELYGKTLTKEQVVNLFLGGVIPTERLNKNVVVNHGFANPDYQKQYPWLAPHVYPTQGIPRDLVITKRVDPIKIAFGLPPLPSKDQISKTLSKIVINQQSEKLAPEQKMLKEISNFSKDISEVTKLDVTTVLPDEERLENFGNLRIIYVKKDHFEGLENGIYVDSVYRNLTTLSRLGGKYKSYLNGDLQKNHIKTGFKFTDNLKAKNQVFGYFLANEKNEIQMSFCFIWEGHEFEIERALIQECVVRSLGFPNLSGGGNPDSLLSFWNNKEIWTQETHKKMIETPPNGLLEGDKYLISLLYDPSIKTGMDYYTVEKLLTE